MAWAGQHLLVHLVVGRLWHVIRVGVINVGGLGGVLVHLVCLVAYMHSLGVVVCASWIRGWMVVEFILRIGWSRVCWFIWCGVFAWSWCGLGSLVEAESGMMWTLAMEIWGG